MWKIGNCLYILKGTGEGGVGMEKTKCKIFTNVATVENRLGQFLANLPIVLTPTHSERTNQSGVPLCNDRYVTQCRVVVLMDEASTWTTIFSWLLFWENKEQQGWEIIEQNTGT
jgi:hypothetical protein